ncbi:uncharacterized protein [Temnothorax nylanderi]|uniref:uncharacterized protein n=1 Tax=Temnothorax nylanderi TaxID=102681 RepID=UPI003A86BF51
MDKMDEMEEVRNNSQMQRVCCHVAHKQLVVNATNFDKLGTRYRRRRGKRKMERKMECKGTIIIDKEAIEMVAEGRVVKMMKDFKEEIKELKEKVERLKRKVYRLEQSSGKRKRDESEEEKDKVCKRKWWYEDDEENDDEKRRKNVIIRVEKKRWEEVIRIGIR